MKNDMQPEQIKCQCGKTATKAGKFKTVNGLMQRYHCPVCRRYFSAGQPIDGMRLDMDKIALVTELLCEGNGIRAAARIAKIDQHTVLKILTLAGAKAEALMEAKTVNMTPRRVEIDEVYGFVWCLQQNAKGNDQRGEQYAYLSVDADTKFILNVHVGKRDTETSRDFLVDLKPRIDGRFQLTSDGFDGYLARFGGAAAIFEDRIDYATEIKTFGTLHKGVARKYNPVVCTSISRQVRHGNPNLNTVTTNHAERTNLSIRMFNRRFTRKTLGYSKKLANHRWSMLLQAAHFNFCRVHSAIEKTPAQAAGVADHQWTVKELLTA